MSKVSNKNVEGGYPYNNASCIHKVKCVYEGNDKSRQGEMIRELECFTAIKWSCIRSGTLQYPELIRLHWIVAAHNVTMSRPDRCCHECHGMTSHTTSPMLQSCCHLVPKLAAIAVIATGVNHRSIESFVFFRTIGNGWVKIPIITSLSVEHITAKDAAQHKILRSPCLINLQVVILHILCPSEVMKKLIQIYFLLWINMHYHF